jgi:phosphoglycolate phosphatase-like HAD superfamily hydrolase
VNLRERKVICWDFDGVIKDSVDVKTRAFVRLFERYGPEVTARVREHHEAHGGMSRYDKMPLYLGWAGEAATAEKVDEFCRRFADATLQAVIESPWVPGEREYLAANCAVQWFALVTATPQSDIVEIAAALDLDRCFREIHGAPTRKAEAVRGVLERTGCAPAEALVIGDSDADYEAAAANRVPFLLRRTPLNQALQERCRGAVFDALVGDLP